MPSFARAIAFTALTGLVTGFCLAGGKPHEPEEQTLFIQHNLVSDGSIPADNTDSNLVNPWGLSQRPNGPFWISDNAQGVATLYNGAGQPFPVGNPLVVTIPVAQGGTNPAPPTGNVFNPFAAQGAFGGNLFIFVTEDGTIASWKPSDGTTAELEVNNFRTDNTGPVYKGVTLITNKKGHFLLVANFRDARIDVFDSNFSPTSLKFDFRDKKIPAGFAPFDVALLQGNVYVTYAKQDDAKHDDVGGAGNGFVNEFSTEGKLLRRIASGGVLNSPWGLAIAPCSWDDFAGDLLVGNFGDGKIHAFVIDRKKPIFEGTLLDQNGDPIVNLGLWALLPGNGGAGSDPHKVYFTAGGAKEDQGLFGSLEPVKQDKHKGDDCDDD